MSYRFFRSGYYEYDKVKVLPVKACEACGCEIPARGGKRFCAPCKDARLEAQIASNRHKYRGRRYGRAKAGAA